MAHRVSNITDPKRTKECFLIGFSSSVVELARTDRFKPTNRVITVTIKKETTEPTPTQGIEPCTTCPISLSPRFWTRVYHVVSYNPILHTSAAPPERPIAFVLLWIRSGLFGIFS